MENFHERLINRRSIRKYTAETLTPEEVKLILEAGLMSPAGKRKNPWHFIAIEDKEMLQQLSVCKEHGALPISKAVLAIVVVCDPVVSDTWIEDGSIATIMMQMQCADLGLGSCWIQIRDRYTATGESAEDVVRGLLDIPLPAQV